MTGEDAIEFFIAGASAIAIGTATFVNPRAPLDVIDGIRDYLVRYEVGSIKELVGSLRT